MLLDIDYPRIESNYTRFDYPIVRFHLYLVAAFRKVFKQIKQKKHLEPMIDCTIYIYRMHPIVHIKESCQRLKWVSKDSTPSKQCRPKKLSPITKFWFIAFVRLCAIDRTPILFFEIDKKKTQIIENKTPYVRGC